MARTDKHRKRRRLKQSVVPWLMLPLVVFMIGWLAFDSLWPEPEEVEIVAPVTEQIEKAVEEEPEPVEEQEPVETDEQQPIEIGSEATDDPEYVSETYVEVVTKPVTPETKEPQKDESLLLVDASGTVFTVYTDSQQGSGFLYTSKGDIVTNAHVVEGSYYVTVANSNGQKFQGFVAGISLTTDIALIRVPDLKGKQPLAIASAMAPIDTPVTAIGSPRNKANTSTTGVITATGVRIEDQYVYDNLYEMTAPIDNGSSGGPLFRNDTGEIIGINSIVALDGDKRGYAMPIHLYSGILSQFSSEADTIEAEENEAPGNIEDAYFSEEMLTYFALDFSELVHLNIVDEANGYYSYHRMEGATSVDEAVKAYRTQVIEQIENPIFEPATIHAIEILDDKAFITMDLVTIGDDAEGQQVRVVKPVQLEVIIDSFGDYKVNTIQ